MPVHHIAFLTPDRMVAWKCLSLQAQQSARPGNFTPVAYASRSRNFLRGIAGQRRPKCDSHAPAAVLWVISNPKYRLRDGRLRHFPPSLTAKIGVARLVTGDVVREWAAADRDVRLKVPRPEASFRAWRYADSVADAFQRSVFRITRDFAKLAWDTHRRSGKRLTQAAAWASVRTAIASPRHSQFLAHTDATKVLGQVLRSPDLVDLPVDECARSVAWKLMSPRTLDTGAGKGIAGLERLAESGRNDTIFLSYRWNEHIDTVAKIGAAILAMRRGIWLDRLQIPAFAKTPIWRENGTIRRKDPPRSELAQLLENAIARSSLFLCLAGKDHADPARDDPAAGNWAQEELRIAHCLAKKTGKPRILVFDLGGAPQTLREMTGGTWPPVRTIAELTKAIARPPG
ncbi:MAG: hypothetical protein OES78_11680 [Chromatiales bacterium]|nr:hypothetical protein [Chromatiales bacterium]MDH4014092.1 hypothetical protein [Chromatiales bacterium]